MIAPTAIDCQDLGFAYSAGREVLRLDHFVVAQGEKVFLHGPSGSGKTTLLSLIAGVLAPTAGTVSVLGRDLAMLAGSRRDAFRGVHVGYLFQLFNLIPYLSVRENITLPCRLHAERRARLGNESADAAAARIAERLEIAEFLSKPVTELSVGQQQRVAAARALIGAPELIIADEPTSALDSDLRDRFLELLFEQVIEAKSTLLFVSHDLSLGRHFDRVASLRELNRAGRS